MNTVPCGLQPFEKTAAYFLSRGHWLVTITEQQRQGSLLAECLSEISYKRRERQAHFYRKNMESNRKSFKCLFCSKEFNC